MRWKTSAPLILASLLFALSFLADSVIAKSRCYSCASANLQSNFLTIKRGPTIRKANPKVFDNFCNGDTWIIREKSLMDCDGPCFKWQQIVNNTGVHSMLTIRGCYNDMFDVKSPETAPAPPNSYCSESRHDLSCLAEANVIEHSCWCHDDACNGAGTLQIHHFLALLFAVPFILQ